MDDGLIYGGGRDALGVLNRYRRANGLPELTAEEYHDIFAAAVALVDGTGEADVDSLSLGGSAFTSMTFTSRAALEAANLRSWVTDVSYPQMLGPVARPVILRFVRDDDGVAVESANGVTFSPATQPEALHYGIIPGTLADDGLIEAATMDAAARGGWLYFRGAALPYQVADTAIIHCSIYGDGPAGKWSNGHETVIQTVGDGVVRRWHDMGTGTSADDESRPTLVLARSELTIRDIRFDNDAGWEHDILVPAMRRVSLERLTTGGAAGISVVFDQTWSDRNTTLKDLHPSIDPAAGCNECRVIDCDLGGDVEGWGIIGTVRNPDSYTSENWIWGWGGSSDFIAMGGRWTGGRIDAACKNGAKMVQSINLYGVAQRIGSRVNAFTIDRGTDVVFSDIYGECVEGNTARFNVTSRTAANNTEKVTLRNCNWIRTNVWFNGVDTGVALTAGGGQSFLDVSDKAGNRWSGGINYSPTGIRPAANEGASLGSSAFQFLNGRFRRIRSIAVDLWFRTLQDGINLPRIAWSVGNSQVRMELQKTLLRLFVPGITKPGVDPEGELPDDPETASDGLVLSPNNIRPNTSGGAGLGSTSYPWSALRSSTVYTDAVVFGATTSGTVRILTGTTSPEGNVAAPVGTLYLQDTADGSFSTVWRKATGTGNTGWVSTGRADLVRGRTRAAFVAEVAAGFDAPVDTVIFAGGDAYRRVTGATWIDALPGWMPDGGYETPQHHGAVDDFVWATKTGTDNTAAIRKVLLSPRRAYFPRRGTGDYRVTGELEVVSPGKIIEFENTGGHGYSENGRRDWTGNVRIVATGTGTKRIRTRRRWRGSAGDPQDAPLSVVLNIQAEGVVTRNISIWSWCDYTNGNPLNEGDEWDVGIFHGTRVGIQHENPQIIGYFRRASLLHDFSNGSNLPRFPDLNGNPYPAGTVLNGADGCHVINPYLIGGRQQIAIVGGLPKPGATTYGDPYYDEILGTTVTDARGNFGSSDFLIVGGRVYGCDHHSNYRRADPTLVGGVLTQAGMESEPDDAPCTLYVSGLAGNASGVIQGVNAFGTRFASFEMFNVRVDYGNRIGLNDCHIEGRSGTRYSTTGVALTLSDYTTTSYGHISGTSRAGNVTWRGGSTATASGVYPHWYGGSSTYESDGGNYFLGGYLSSRGSTLDLRANQTPVLGLSTSVVTLKGQPLIQETGEMDLRAASGSPVRLRSGSTTLATVSASAVDLRGQTISQQAGSNLVLGAQTGQDIRQIIGSTLVTVASASEVRLPQGLMRLGGAGGPTFELYAGSPEGVLARPVGSLVLDTTNGGLWVKNTGTGNTGWLRLATV